MTCETLLFLSMTARYEGKMALMIHVWKVHAGSMLKGVWSVLVFWLDVERFWESELHLKGFPGMMVTDSG